MWNQIYDPLGNTTLSTVAAADVGQGIAARGGGRFLPDRMDRPQRHFPVSHHGRDWTIRTAETRDRWRHHRPPPATAVEVAGRFRPKNAKIPAADRPRRFVCELDNFWGLPGHACRSHAIGKHESGFLWDERSSLVRRSRFKLLASAHDLFCQTAHTLADHALERRAAVGVRRVRGVACFWRQDFCGGPRSC